MGRIKICPSLRAVWDEENAKWWFNVVDVVSVLNEQCL